VPKTQGKFNINPSPTQLIICLPFSVNFL